jgi:hypothetical protein
MSELDEHHRQEFPHVTTWDRAGSFASADDSVSAARRFAVEVLSGEH